NMKHLSEKFKRVQTLIANKKEAGIKDIYEMKHAQLILEFIHTVVKRHKLISKKEIPLLPESSRRAVDDSFMKTADNLYNGLILTLEKYTESVHKD
ncbi:hypothetical protein JW926_01840, partial [Candidatus Sumerlaeota bacterium]|nr:hypothetical protein [Candidatus Sumerlaeota bacterium]